MLNNFYSFKIDVKSGLLETENVELKNASNNTYIFQYSLFRDDEPVILEEGTTATLYSKHTNRNTVLCKGEVKGNVCTFKIQKNLFIEKGIYETELELIHNQDILNINTGYYKVLNSLSRADINMEEETTIEVLIDNKISIHNQDEEAHQDIREKLLQLTESNLSKEQVDGFIDEKINPLKEEINSSIQEHIEQAESIYLKDEDIENLLRNEDINKLLKDISFNENQLTLTFKDDTTKKVSLDTLTVDLSQYVKNESLLQKLNEYYPKVKADELFLKKNDAEMTYAKRTDIEDFITSESLEPLATKDELIQYLKKAEAETIYAKKTEIPSIEGLLSSSQAESTYVKKTDLSTYALKTDLEPFITNEDLTGYALKTDLEGFLTDESLTGYVKETSLNNYYQKTETDNLFLKKNEIPEIPNLEAYALKTDLNNHYTKAKTDELFLKKTEAPQTPNLDNYYTKEKTDELFTKKAELESTFTTKLEPYITQAKADERYQLKGEQGTAEIPEDVVRKADLEGFYTKTKTDELFLKKAEKPNLEPYALKTEVENTYAKKSELPSIDSFITTETANQTFIKKTEAESTYAKKTDLSTYALKSEIPSTEGFITKETANQTFMTKTEASSFITEAKVREILQAEMNKILTALE